MAFVDKTDMSASYKPVMLRAILDLADATGRVNIDEAARAFHEFYRQRRRAGLLVEGERYKLADPDRVTPHGAREVMLDMPFKKFAQKQFLRYDRDLAFVRFAPALWRQLTADDHAVIRGTCSTKIDNYYERLAH